MCHLSKSYYSYFAFYIFFWIFFTCNMSQQPSPHQNIQMHGKCIDVSESSSLVSVSVKLDRNKTSSNIGNKLVFLIDISGSMRGDPSAGIHAALSEIYRQDPEALGQTPVLCYNQEVYATNLQKFVCTPLSASGFTYFNNIFLKAKEMFQTESSENLDFVFMTDGDDTSGKFDQLRETMNQVKGLCQVQKNTRYIKFHTIAFGDCVKKDFCSQVVELGNQPGLFRFASTPKELAKVFEELFDVQQNTLQLEFVGKDGSFLSQLATLTSKSQHIETYEVTFVCPRLHAAEERLQVRLGSTLFECTLEKVASEQMTSLQKLKLLDLQHPQTSEETLQLIKQVSSLLVKTKSVVEREQAQHLKESLLERLQHYLKLFNESKVQKIDDTFRMKLESLKHDSTIKRARQFRELEKRKAQNLGHYTSLDADIQQFINQSKQTEAYTQMVEQESSSPECVYTMETLQEVFDDPLNYMGLGILAKRTDLCIDSPSMGVKLFQVSNTTLSYHGLEEAMTKAVEERGDQAHGGFSNKDNKEEEFEDVYCLVGNSREKINLLVPRYIHALHAQKLMKLSRFWLGYLFTMSCYGYHPSQPGAFLALVGQMVLKFNKTQKMKEDLLDIFQLGKLIIEQNEDFRKCTMPLFEKFQKNVHGRSAQFMQNLLLPLMIAALTGKLCPYLVLVHEESTRRDIKKKQYSSEESWAICLKLMYASPTSSSSSSLKSIPQDSLERIVIDQFADYFHHPQSKIPKISLPTTSKEKVAVACVPDPTQEVLPSIQAYRRKTKKFLSTFVTNINELLSTNYPTEIVPSSLEEHERERRNLLVSFLPSSLASDLVDTTNVLQIVNDAFKQKTNYQENSQAQKEINAHFSKFMSMTDNLEAFGAMVRLYCPSRGGALFDELVEHLLRRKDAEKLVALLTNQIHEIPLYTGVLEHQVWVPLSRDIFCRIVQCVGKQTVKEIEEEHKKQQARMGHLYRLSNKTNRHGYSNLHPNQCLFQEFKGYPFVF